MNEYLIIVHGNNKIDNTEQERQVRVERYNKWAEELGDQHVAAQRLKKAGRYLKSRDEIFSDGPFLESKELVVGFGWIKAKNIDEAVAITKTCPLMESHELELREIYI